jgi:hypothetical protein
MKTFIVLLMLCLPVFSQTKSIVTESGSPPEKAWVNRYFADGSGNIQYACSALQSAPLRTWVLGTNLLSIVVSSNTATVTTVGPHGLYPGVKVDISASGTVTLNGSYKIITADPTSALFTITTVAVPDATYTVEGTTVATTFPLDNESRWSIQVYTYSGSNVQSYWAHPNTQSASMITSNAKCSERSSY